MPSISGTTLIAVIKKKYPETPIIAMTGYGHHSKEIVSEPKADLILDKLFDMEALKKAIKNLLIKSSSSFSQNLM